MRKMRGGRGARMHHDLGALPSPVLWELLTFAQMGGGENPYEKSVSRRNCEAGAQRLHPGRDTRRCAPHRSVTPARDNHPPGETPDGSHAALHELPARSEITHRGLPRGGKLHSHQALLICVIRGLK